MKVVLFCGGLGTRLREYSETIPKPMVPIGSRPILWHLMKYYAFYGHTEFILCLGYRGDVIRQYFLDYNECLSNDFTLSQGGREIKLFNRDIEDWKITFVDTGLNANVGQRLRAVRHLLEGEDAFLANYSDGLSDLPLPKFLADFESQGRTASFVCVRPHQTFHIVRLDDAGSVESIRHFGHSGLWINGGFFAFRPSIFDYLAEGEELVLGPFDRLIEKGQLGAYRHEGFWSCMDTFKDKQMFDDMDARGDCPWKVWAPPGRRPAPGR